MRHLKPNGVCLFVHNSNFSGEKSVTCTYHSLHDVKAHFRGYPGVQVFFSTRTDTWLMRKYAFHPIVTRINIGLSKLLSLGGDIVVVVKGQHLGDSSTADNVLRVTQPGRSSEK
jgi:hypothetical protein